MLRQLLGCVAEGWPAGGRTQPQSGPPLRRPLAQSAAPQELLACTPKRRVGDMHIHRTVSCNLGEKREEHERIVQAQAILIPSITPDGIQDCREDPKPVLLDCKFCYRTLMGCRVQSTFERFSILHIKGLRSDGKSC